MLQILTPTTVDQLDQVRGLMRSFVAWHSVRHEAEMDLVNKGNYPLKAGTMSDSRRVTSGVWDSIPEGLDLSPDEEMGYLSDRLWFLYRSKGAVALPEMREIQDRIQILAAIIIGAAS